MINNERSKEEKGTMIKRLSYSFAVGTLIFGVGMVSTLLPTHSAMATHEEERSGSTTRTDRGTDRGITGDETIGGGRETGQDVGVPGIPGPGMKDPGRTAPERPGATGDTTGTGRGTSGDTGSGASGTTGGKSGGSGGGTGGGAPGGTSGGGTGGGR
ncbi:MAG: hypothetical protein DWB56_01395 [Candidatus Jettenia sp.]|uniref:Uncharacterized protein n=2 Tax=Candidatus Jettenia TaxID=360731 RepID=I3IP16_9BACT|nr:MAG: hypothetical protein EDM77_01315 [Candidatus Jettenia sp. AMX1]MBC6927609.1 hypothetical protein [Candidatus Jettenia sp.]MCE7881277.1 hypothetical protein [Candidatus Jettenia sp. AMX1]MCQ3925993.1 hypothetical protein [Candidatus Jettenia sp.]GAB63461.1 hypothetical protein KSU1_D0152 [Candidatus Jettenia caeni]